ncbi:hepatocyte growth factor receptor-like isoform X2 [Amblyomma americanum]
MLNYTKISALLAVLVTAAAKESVVMNEFRAHQAPLQDILYVDQNGAAGVIVLAGRNALYKLSGDNLSLLATYSTGPKYDSRLCPPDPLDCETSRTETANDNQVLLKLGSDSLILACGTTDQGMCSIHHLLNDLEVRNPMDKNLPVNYVASRSSTAAFFGSGRNSDVLFVASAYDGRPPNYHPYELTARVLNKQHSFSIRSSTPAAPSFLNVKDHFKQYYRTRYVYGFSYNGFAYFVTVQNKGASLNNFETRLARVCESDTSFQTYTALLIRCLRKGTALSSDATIAISASLQHSAKGSEHGSEILAVAFGTPLDGNVDMSDPSKGSELCFFDMRRVESAFRETIENCNKGTPKAKLSSLFHDKMDLNCVLNEQAGDNINVCTPDVNSYIEGLEPLTGTATMMFMHGLVTSITVMQQNGVTVAWVGDSEGYLHKVAQNDDSSELLYWTDLSNGKGTPMERSTALDSKGMFGYFLIGDKVLKFPVGSCSIYRTCSKCMRSREDPLACGWCGGRCAHSAECPHGTHLEFEHCPIQVHSVAPNSGPTSGGTMITFVGENFGSWWRESSNSIEVTIGGHACQIINWVSTLVTCKTPPAEGAGKVDITISVNDTNRDAKKNYDVVNTLTLPSAFEYKTATLSGVQPIYGPAAGGTNITLFGKNLDTGTQRVVTIGATFCKIHKFNSTSLECLTGAAPGYQVDHENQVILAIDGVNIPFVSEDHLGSTFTYLSNPKIESIAPRTAIFSEQPAIVADGVHLHTVSRPMMVTRVFSLDRQKQQSITKACSVMEHSRQLLCPGPSLTEFSVISSDELQKHQSSILAQVSFLMDGLHLPPNSTGSEGYFTLIYRPPPASYIPRTKAARITGLVPRWGPVAGGTSLTLHGMNLNSGSRRIVTVGDSACSINRVGNAFLDCTTSAMTRDHEHKEMRVALRIDGVNVPVVGTENFTSTFTYKPDPLIYDIAPMEANSNTSVIHVRGKHLDSVAAPVMVTRVTSLKNKDQDSIKGACRVSPGGLTMQCSRASLMESSVISSADLEQQHQLPIVVQISFRMDGLHLPLNSAGEESYFNFTYLPERGPIVLSEPEEDAFKLHSAAIIVAVSLLPSVLGVWICYRCCQTRKSKLTKCDESLDLMEAEIRVRTGQGPGHDQCTNDSEGQTLIASSFPEDTKALLENKRLLIDRVAVTLGPVIGIGRFGRVYQGFIQLEPKGHAIMVAVKTLRQSYAVRETGRKNFLEEALIMKDFCHPNVLHLHGLTMDEKNGLMVITPYMEHGDLLNYVRDKRNDIKPLQAITFCRHVAEGMRYLAEMKFVHRDLAARNCMLSKDLVVRVADFGFSRDVYEKQYYRKLMDGTKLPLRWMAPESVEKGIYNYKTDVWAYGVLLWEVMTWGETPYSSMEPWDILEFLNEGLRLQLPKSCPPELYQIMLQCWHQDPAKRPPFSELVTDIATCTSCIKKGTRNNTVSLNAGYVNNPGCTVPDAITP